MWRTFKFIIGALLTILLSMGIGIAINERAWFIVVLNAIGLIGSAKLFNKNFF